MAVDATSPPGTNESPARPDRWREWPIGLVVLVVLAALGIVAAGSFRHGCIVLAGAVVLAFFLRLLLPTADAGMLAVRSRSLDLLVLGVLAGTISVLAFLVPAG